MTKAVFTTKDKLTRRGRSPPPPADRPPLVEFLKSLDLAGLDLTRERDVGQEK